MSKEIKVPELGESVVEATVGRWQKEPGDPVSVGDVLVSLETDKVDIEIGAEVGGVLSKIVAAEGSDVAIGDILAVIDASNGQPAKKQASEPQKTGGEEAKAKQPAAKEKTAETDGEEKVTPVARRMASEHGINLAEVSGSGPGGRVTKQDVQAVRDRAAASDAAQKEKSASERPAVPQSMEHKEDPREERVRLSRRRRTIARRLVEAQQTAAMLTTFNEIDMGAVMDLRRRRQEQFVKRHDVKLGFMSFFVKASIGALKAFPHLNAEIQEDEMVLKHYYDIGIAVGAEEGLVVPVLRDANRISFAQIEQAIQKFVEQTREGTLSLEDLRGGTFTITNGGVFGSMLSTPILNPPQVAILGLHKIEKRPVAVDGQVVIRPMMYVALSYDHRIVDGREAVQFLVRLKELIEDPEALLLEG